MKRLDRLNAILIQLQSKRVVKSAEIADRFNISQRTVYRDIRALEEAGVPIGAEAGTGYFLMENFQLPPIMFTNEEASAILLGEKLVEKMSDEQSGKHYQSAALKIRAVLKPTDKDYLEQLYGKVSVYNWAHVGGQCQHLFLGEIQHALVNKQIIEIEYQKKNSTECFNRQVEPIGLCNYASRWHLFAWCRERNDYRDFRLDRIRKFVNTGIHYSGEQHISIDDFVARSWAIDEPANIRLVVSAKRKQNIDESKFYYGFLDEKETADGFEMKFYNPDFGGFAAWLVATRSLARIEHPDELRQIFDLYVGELIAMKEQQDEDDRKRIES